MHENYGKLRISGIDAAANNSLNFRFTDSTISFYIICETPTLEAAFKFSNLIQNYKSNNIYIYKYYGVPEKPFFLKILTTPQSKPSTCCSMFIL